MRGGSVAWCIGTAVMTAVPQGKLREVMAMLKAIHAQKDREVAQAKAALVFQKLESMRSSCPRSGGMPRSIRAASTNRLTGAVVNRISAESAIARNFWRRRRESCVKA
jgi:hypothetical protein